MIVSFILVTFVCSIIAGFLRSRLLLQQKEINLSNALQFLPEMYVLVPTAVAGIIAMIVVRSHHQLLWYLPIWLDLISMHLIWLMSGGVFAYLFTIGLTIGLATNHPEKYKLAFATTLLGVTICGMHIYWNLPIYKTLTNLRTAGGYVMQTSSSSCAAASAANVSTYLGLSITEKQMAKLTGTTVLGTSPGQIVRAFRSTGITAKKKTLRIAQLAALPQPAILFIDYPGLGPDSHAVALLPTTTAKLRIIDPLSGSYDIAADRFPWRWRGHLLTCHRNE